MTMQLQLALAKYTLAADSPLGLEAALNAIWVESGTIRVDDQPIAAEEAVFASAGKQITCAATEARILVFSLEGREGRSYSGEDGTLLAETIDWPATDGLLRLDRVTFGPGVVAWRHVHAGAGIRYLTQGELSLDAEGEPHVMHAGTAWYEAANSPVEATAANIPVTQFVRGLVVPAAYAGKPTIRFLREEDRQKPMLQKNHRFFEVPFDFSAARS